MVYSQRYERLKAALRGARKAADLTQEGLARKLGKQQAYISKIERGERYIGVMDFLEWCEACDADPAEILKSL